MCVQLKLKLVNVITVMAMFIFILVIVFCTCIYLLMQNDGSNAYRSKSVSQPYMQYMSKYDTVFWKIQNVQIQLAVC